MSKKQDAWKRDFDVYDRIKELGIDLGRKEEVISPSKGRRICSLTFTPSGLVFTSGVGSGIGAVTNDDKDVEKGFQAGREGRDHTYSYIPLGLRSFWNIERRLVLCEVYWHGQFSWRRGFF